MKKLVFYILLLLCLFQSFSQDVQWISFDSINENMRKEKRPVLVFVYADWCKFCQMQEQTAFKNDSVKAVLKNYYCVKLNAEEKADITFLGKTYNYVSSGNGEGYHQLAKLFATKDEKTTYPTTIVLNKLFEVKYQLVGMQTAKNLIKTIK